MPYTRSTGSPGEESGGFYPNMEGADGLKSRQRRNSAMMDDRAKSSHTNYGEVVEKLNKYYQLVKKQIIRYQHIATGLFPMDTGTPSCTVSHIRDNIHCAVAMWALSQAYKRIDDDQGRTKELSLTAVKTMRGILECWMYQAGKVEIFKKTQSSKNCLHVLFHTVTQQTVTEDEEYEHLQLDCVALYLIFLVQMTQSGCSVIWGSDEVNFIQNLVFYIERAYRTPDFGVWERGSKYNNGSVELHASSIGTAKAALEAINGMNMYGNQGSNSSVIFIDIDAHYRNRIIFDTILPRESSSENTDAALIMTISWPVFAIHEEQLVHRTLDKALRKLKGKYGLKRFLRDGYGTVLEDKSRKYYKTSDVKNFDGIECEWPMFYCYLAIDSIYKGDTEKAQEYMNLLKPLLLDSDSGPLIPKYYYVPKDSIELERKEPGSQYRQPTQHGIVSEHPKRENIFLWGQSVYIIAELLVEGLINISELDPVKRHLPAAERPKANSRYSSFQSSPVDLVIQVALIAESTSLQQMLATYGIQTQTPHQVEPIQIWPPSDLARAYEQLGVNNKLGLTGRPPRPIGGLGTAKIFRACGTTFICPTLVFETCDFYMSRDIEYVVDVVQIYRACGYTFVCYSLLFQLSDFYLAQDIEFVIDEVKSDLAFLGKCWKLAGRPTFCMIIREENLNGPGSRYVLDLLTQFKQGDCDGTKIRLGRLQEFISTGCIEHLDFLDMDMETTFTPLIEKDKGMRFKSFTDIPKSLKQDMAEDWRKEDDYHTMSVEELVHLGTSSSNFYYQAQALKELAKRKGLYEHLDDLTYRERIQMLSHVAGTMQIWSVVRYCSSVLGKLVDSLAPSITSILVRGKQLMISVFGQSEHVIDKPMTPNEIKEILYTKLYPYDSFQAVLQQELIINIGTLITSTPELFDGILKIRIGLVVEAMKLEMTHREGKDNVYSLSPSAIKKLLYQILDKRVSEGSYYSIDRSIVWNRQLDGYLNRVPREFFERVWHILERTPSGIKLSGFILPQQPTLSEMTQYELNFSLVVDQMLSKIVEPAYRQLIVETIVIVDSILTRNPELSFQKPIELDMIFKDAIMRFTKDRRNASLRDEKDLLPEDLAAFFNTAPNALKGTNVYIVRAVMNMLLESDIKGITDDQCLIS